MTILVMLMIRGTVFYEEGTGPENKKTLSETIKARKTADAFEHIKIVNNDIQKVFAMTNRETDKEKDNFIPDEY